MVHGALANCRARAHARPVTPPPTPWSRLARDERVASALVVMLLVALVVGTGATACRMGLALVQRAWR